MEKASRMRISPLAPLILCLSSCSLLGIGGGLPDGVEAMSLTGAELRPMKLEDTTRVKLEDNLSAAKAEAEANPGDEMAAIWYGRRLAYLGRYNEAVAVYTDALGDHPTSYRLFRHRGHRYITLRRFEDAVIDLTQASRYASKIPDKIEPDGAPNAAGIPRSTTRSNIEYHLGLAHYLRGEWGPALEAYQRCLYFSRVNDDMFVATAYWNVLTMWRLERHDEVADLLEEVRPTMDVIENHDYHELLLLFKGMRTEEEILERWNAGEGVGNATLGFGIGAYYLEQGRDAEAQALFREIVAGGVWPAFGAIAAEVEVAGR